MSTSPSIEELIGHAGSTIREILQVIDTNAQGTCFIVDKTGKLSGIATDGDIRRALLRGYTLDTPIETIMRNDFISLPVNTSAETIQEKLSSLIRYIPLVDENLRPVDYASRSRLHQIPIMEPQLNGNELGYITDCIKTGWISSKGAYVRQFEKMFAEYCAVPYSLAVSNGTVALHLALDALGICEGDEVIVPDMTFAASINAIIYTGATPVLADVTRDTWTLDPVAVEKAITPRTKAIMPVHLYGHPCDMDQLNAIAARHKLLVVEDCAQALGSLHKGKPVGSFGDAATFSFFGNKIITTGEGGMVLIRDEQAYERALTLRDHGMSRQKRYWHDVVGYNYRMTNLQGAIGVAQMERLDQFVATKRRIAFWYDNMFASLNGVTRQVEMPWAFSSRWLYTILVNGTKGIFRDELIDKLLKNGIETRPAFYPLHQMPPYKRYVSEEATFPNSLYISESGISLPSSVTITNSEMESIEKVVASIFKTRQLSLAER